MSGNKKTEREIIALESHSLLSKAFLQIVIETILKDLGGKNGDDINGSFVPQEWGNISTDIRNNLIRCINIYPVGPSSGKKTDKAVELSLLSDASELKPAQPNLLNGISLQVTINQTGILLKGELDKGFNGKKNTKFELHFALTGGSINVEK